MLSSPLKIESAVSLEFQGLKCQLFRAKFFESNFFADRTSRPDGRRLFEDMSLSICHRCALSLARTQCMSTRTRLSRIRSLRRNVSTVQQQGLSKVSVQPSKSIQNILQSLDPLLQTSLISFPLNSILAPYNTFTMSQGFVQPRDPEVIALLRAVANKQDNEWWELYTQLSLTGGLKRLKRTHFSLILRALHPVDFHLNTGLPFSDDLHV